MVNKKRYTTGENPVYDQYYMTYKNKSQILRPTNATFAPNSQDKQGVISTIEEIKIGMQDIEREMRRLNSAWEEYAQRKVNEGFERPEKICNEYAEELYKLEVRWDVRNEELEKCRKLLAEYEKEENKRKPQLFQYGLTGDGALMHGIISEVDGQKVSIIKNWPVIDEPSSPFDGMRVCDYRKHLAVPWKREKENRLAVNEAYNVECRAKGVQPDPAKYVSLNPPLPTKWPEGVLNYKK